MVSCIAVWKHAEIVQALTLFVNAVVKTEATNESFTSSTSIENSGTKQILNSVALGMTSLSEASSSSPDIKLFASMIIELCTSMASVVESSEIRAIIYQIIMTGLASDSPSMLVLPCIVKLSLIEGEDRVKEVNRLLTGLLMNYKLANVFLNSNFE